jgi:hypothetical protein
MISSIYYKGTAQEEEPLDAEKTDLRSLDLLPRPLL